MSASASRFQNSAGRGLPHIPRRRSSASRQASFTLGPSTSETSQNDASSAAGPSKSSGHKSGNRGRTRPHFAFADDDTGTSSDEENARGNASGEGNDTDSDCQTPTQTSISRFREETVQPWGIIERTSKIIKSEDILSSKVKLEEDADESISTIAFPSRGQSPDRSSSSMMTITPGSQAFSSDYRRAKSEEEFDSDILLTPTRTLSESASLNLTGRSVIRNRAGQIVKPVLKQQRSSSVTPSRPRVQAHSMLSISMSALDDFTSTASAPCVSAPMTPDPKIVHFDTQLEHVRLFRSGQRPIAVSRDSSPTRDGDTTSGGEADSAAEVFERPLTMPARRRRSSAPLRAASDEEDEVRRSLSMHLTNMHWSSPTLSGFVGDMPLSYVHLEGLHLAEDNSLIQGFVRVRNVAFEKAVLVRFTFDGWQTTSEVCAVWKESCLPFLPTTPIASVLASSSRSPITSYNTSLTQKLFGGLDPTTALYDRFSFRIHLQDLLLRIEEKTLVLAVCYKTAGEEYWDNNDGQNYRATFERRSRGLMERLHRTVPSTTSPIPTQLSEDGNNSGPDFWADKDKMVKGEPVSVNRKHIGLGLDFKTKREEDISPPSSPTKRGRAPTPGGSSTMARLSDYNFDNALKNPSSWKAPASLAFPLKRPGMPKSLKHAISPPPSLSDGTEQTRNEHRLPVSFNSHWVDFGRSKGIRGSPRDAGQDEPMGIGMSEDDGMSGRDEMNRYTNVDRYRLSDATPEDQPFSRLRGCDGDSLERTSDGETGKVAIAGPMEYFSFGSSHPAGKHSPSKRASDSAGPSNSKSQRTGIYGSTSLAYSRSPSIDTNKPSLSHGLSLITGGGVHGDFSTSSVRVDGLPDCVDDHVLGTYSLGGGGGGHLPFPLSDDSSELSTPSIVTDTPSPTMTLSPSSPSEIVSVGLPTGGTLDSGYGYAEFMKRFQPGFNGFSSPFAGTSLVSSDELSQRSKSEVDSAPYSDRSRAL